MTKKILKMLFIGVGLLVFSLNNAQADSWPTFKGFANNVGVSAETIEPPLELEWSQELCADCMNLSSPVTDSTQVYVAEENGVIHAYAISDGTENWSYDTTSSIWSTPTVEGTRIYFGATNGTFYALNTADGTEAWTYDAAPGVEDEEPEAMLTVSPVTDGTNIYFASEGGKVFGLSLADGTEAWTPFSPEGEGGEPAEIGNSALALVDGILYLGVANLPRIYAINTTTGAEVGHTDIDPDYGTFFSSAPAIADNRVFIGTDAGMLHVFNRTTGNLLASEQLVGSIEGTPTVVGGGTGTLYIGTLEGYLYSFDISSQTMNWVQVFEEPISSSPVYVNGYLLVGIDGFYVLNASNGEMVWNYNTGPVLFSTPAIADGQVYVVSKAFNSNPSALYAFSESLVEASFKKNWSYNTGPNSIKKSNMVVDDSYNVYVGTEAVDVSGDTGIFSVDQDGAYRWKFNTDAKPLTSLTVDNSNNALFFGTADSKFYGVNTSDGTEKCSKNLDASDTERMMSTGLVIPAQNVLLAGTNRGKIYAMNLTNCNVAASYDTTWRMNVSRAIRIGSNVWFNQGMHRLIGLDNSFNQVGLYNFYSGDPWEKDVEFDLPITMAKNGNVIYAGGDQDVFAIDVTNPASPSLVWQYTSPHANEWGMYSILYDADTNLVIAVSDHGTVYGIDASDGSEAWVFHDLARTYPGSMTNLHGGQPVIWDDMLAVVIGPQVVVLSLEDGNLRSNYTYNLAKTAPIYKNGNLLVAMSGGRLVAVKVNNYSSDITASTGGTLSTIYGDALEIPAGALASDTTITLAISANDQTPPAGTIALPRKYDFGPHGTGFDPVAIGRFSYQDSDLEGEPEADIRVFIWNDLVNDWKDYSGTLDVLNKEFVVNVDQF